MAIPQIVPYDYFYQWRDKTNLIANQLGDLELINVASGDRDSFVEAVNKVISNIGSLTLLTTTAKDSIVNSINELDSEIGVLSTLTTTAKTTLVAAINEHQTKIGTASLTTTAQSLLAAVNELDAEHGTLSSLTTSYKASFVGSINELVDKIGPLSSLNTTNKNNLVEAVSEVQTELGAITSLTTTNKTSAVSAINELDSDVGNTSQLLTTDKTSSVSAINEVFKMSLITGCNITVGTETGNVIKVSVQLKNSEGNNIAFRANVFVYLSDSNDGSILMTTEHSGGWAIGTAGLLIPQIANKSARVTTNSSGAFNIDITEAASKSAYLVVTLPNGQNVVSSVITHAA